MKKKEIKFLYNRLVAQKFLDLQEPPRLPDFQNLEMYHIVMLRLSVFLLMLVRVIALEHVLVRRVFVKHQDI